MANVVRTVSQDGSLRGITIDITGAVAEIAKTQSASGGMAKLLGELCVGSIMVHRLMSPDQRVQLALQSESGRVFIDSYPDGTVRGLVNGSVELGEGTLLHVTRVLDNHELHTGTVETSAAGVASSIVAYMKSSEQVASIVDIFVADDLSNSAGWMLQALPSPVADTIETSIDHLTTLPNRDEMWQHPIDVVATMVMGVPHKLYDEPAARFACHCSRNRVLNAVRTMPDHEIEEVKQTNEVIEISCEYCGTHYSISPDEI